MKSVLKAVHFKKPLFIWRILCVLKHFYTAQHFWAAPPALCQTQKWCFNTTLKIHFAPLVWKSHGQKQGERCELMHSWINQRHYHQRWSYGFVVALMGYLEAAELICTVNWDKFCLAQYESRSETKKIQLTASRAAVSGQYGVKSLVIEELARKVTFIGTTVTTKAVSQIKDSW